MAVKGALAHSTPTSPHRVFNGAKLSADYGREMTMALAILIGVLLVTLLAVAVTK